MQEGLNASPELHAESDEQRSANECATEADPNARDRIDSLEIFGPRLPRSLLFASARPRELGRAWPDFFPT